MEILNEFGVFIVIYLGIGGGVLIIEGYKIKNNIFFKKDKKNIFIVFNGFMSIDESSDLINLIVKLIFEEISMVFLESDYVIDLLLWF